MEPQACSVAAEGFWGAFTLGFCIMLIITCIIMLMDNSRLKLLFTRDPQSLAALKRNMLVSERAAELITYGLDEKSAEKQANDELIIQFRENYRELHP